MNFPRKFWLALTTGWGAAAGILVSTAVFAFWSVGQTNEANHQAQDRLQKLARLTLVGQYLQDIESSKSSYLITENKGYFIRYVNQLFTLESELDHLQAVAWDDRLQQTRLNQLLQLLKQRLTQIDSLLALRKLAPLQAGPVQASEDEGLKINDSIHLIISQMCAAESSLLVQYQNRATNHGYRANGAFCLAFLLSLLIFTQLYRRLVAEAKKSQTALEDLQRTQNQLIQQEKMSSLGQLVAGVAHEINNPVNFIYGNISHVREYTSNFLSLVSLYQQTYPDPTPEIEDKIEEIDLDFLQEDLPKLLGSMNLGLDRIRNIVLSLRNFSRMDEAEFKEVDLHEGIDSTLLILQHRLKARPDHPAINVEKHYAMLPLVSCYAGQLNQVFMNILSNAIDALEENNRQRRPEEIAQRPSQITIRTWLDHVGESSWVKISIRDNGTGMPERVKQRIFDPFFTTKPVGKGTGLGMPISYQVVTEKHQGRLSCTSQENEGTEFLIELPLRLSLALAA